MQKSIINIRGTDLIVKKGSIAYGLSVKAVNVIVKRII